MRFIPSQEVVSGHQEEYREMEIGHGDGASGAGTVLASWRGLSTQNTGGSSASCVNITGLNITGSANTAMTLEFNVASAANQFESVVLGGYSTP